jgi:hypothetical protein
MTFKVKDGISIAGTTFVDGSRNITIGNLNGNTPIHSGNYSSYIPSLTGSGASGTWGISITGNAATVSSITSSQVTTALGFTPYNATNPAGYITSSALSGYLTSSTAASTYLPLAGGTLSGILTANSGIYSPKIGIASSNLADQINGAPWYGLGFSDLTFGAQQVPQFAGYYGLRIRTASTVMDFAPNGDPGSINVLNGGFKVGGNTVLHAANYTSYAVPLSNGTATNITLGARVNSSSYGGNTSGMTGHSFPVEIRANGNKPTLTWHYESVATRHIALDSDGALNVYNPGESGGAVFKVGGNIAFHTGNYTSYTMARDAWNGNLYFNNDGRIYSTIMYDTNDTSYYIDANSGTRLNSLTINDGNVQLYKSQTVDMSNTGVYSTSTYYPVLINVPTSGVWIEIQNNLNSNVPSWATHGAGFTLNLRWFVTGGGWGTTDIKRRVEQYHERFTNATICGGITQLGNSSNEIVWLRGGGTYYFRYSRDVQATVYTTTYSYGGQSAAPTSSAQNSVWNSYSGTHVSYNTDVYATSRMDSPIFYDWNDTGYYVDANSTSRFYDLSIQGPSHKYLTINPGNGYEAMVRYIGGSGSSWYVGKRTATELVGTADFHFYSEATGLTVAAIDTAGNTFSRGSSRAPIFYDSNNTAYYTDPDSISSMFGVAIRGDTSSTNTQNQLFLWSAGNTTTSAIGFKGNGGYFGNPTGAGDGYNTYLTMDTPGRGWVFREGVGGTDFGASYTSGWILNNGVWLANRSMRAPVFYDSNDTGYYVDPNGTTNINHLRINGNWGGGNPWDGQINIRGTYPSMQFRSTTSGSMWLRHMDGGGDIQHYYAGDGVDSSNWSIKHTMYKDGTFYSASSMRSPMFYDADNTAYYSNPAGSSYVYNIDANFINTRAHIDMYGPLYSYKNDLGTIVQSFNQSASNAAQFYIRHDYGNVIIENSRGATFVYGTYVQTNNSLRAPIFYDSNNTNYYCDPNGFSQFSYGNFNAAPNGRTLSLGSDDTNRIINDSNRSSLVINAIYYPHLYINATSNASNTNHGPVFSMTGVLTAGGYRRWGMGIANTNPDCFSWGYYDNETNPHYGVGGTFGYTATNAKMWLNTGGSLMTTGDMRAPIFYDSDDTAYYLNVAGYSQINGNGSVNGSAGAGLSIWSQSGNGAIMSFHRGNYYAVNIGLDSDNIIRIGGWSAAANRLQMDMGGNLTMAGNVTAYSDERLKKDWKVLPSNFIESLAQVKSGTYTRIDSEEHQVGVSAQDLQKFLEEAVQTDAAGMLSVNYGGAALASAVELAKEVVDLKSQLKQQQLELEELKVLVKSLLANR